MMRREAISYEDVTEACARLVAREHKPTLRAVHAELDNRGSMSTLAPLVRQWFAEEAEKRATEALDPELLQSIAAWARRKVAQETVAQSNELRELREQCTALEATLAEVEKRAGDGDVALATATDEHEAAKARLERDNEALRRQLAEAEARQQEQLDELAELRRSLRTSEVALAETKVMALNHRERAVAETAKVEGLQKQAAAAQAKVDGQLERGAFLEREAADARANARAKDGEIQFLRQRLVQEHDECRAAQAKVEQSQSRLAELTAVQQELSRARQDNEMLRRRFKKAQRDARLLEQSSGAAELPEQL